MARTYGRGSVYFDPQTKKWIFAWSEGSGKARKRRRKFFASEAEANSYRRRHEHTSEGRRGEYADRPLKDWCKRWIADHVHWKIATRASYEHHVKIWIDPYIGHVRLRDMDPTRIARWMERLREKGVASSCVKAAYVALRACLGYAFKMNQISGNPCLQVIRPVHKKRKRRAMTPEDLVRYFEQIRGQRLEAVPVLVSMTGIREGEAFALHWPDVDLENATVDINKNVVFVEGQFHFQDKPKGGKWAARVMHLPPDAVESLRQHRERMRKEGRDVENGLVFMAKWRTKIVPLECSSFLTTFHYPALRRAGLPAGNKADGFTFHDLRHTYATIAKRGGRAKEEVSRALGHANTVVTDTIYDHSWDDPVVGIGSGETVADAVREARRKIQAEMAQEMAQSPISTSQPQA